MSEMNVGVRDLKARLSAYLRQVKAGRTIVITEHGEPIGRLSPVGLSLEARLQAMVEAGQATWSGKKLGRVAPVARVRGKRTVAELVVEDRE